MPAHSGVKSGATQSRAADDTSAKGDAAGKARAAKNALRPAGGSSAVATISVRCAPQAQS